MDYFQQLNAELQTLDLGEIFTASSLFTTIVLISVIFFVRRALVRYIWRDAEVLAKEQRRWIIRIKNISAILLLMGLVLIWAPQLHTFALSIAAFAAAVVIATIQALDRRFLRDRELCEGQSNGNGDDQSKSQEKGLIKGNSKGQGQSQSNQACWKSQQG